MSEGNRGSEVASGRSWLVKNLPRWPAILLVPAILGMWAALCALPRGHPLPTPLYERGVPFAFIQVLEPRSDYPNYSEYHTVLRFTPLLVDLAVALAAAYLLAMAVDRLVFPWIRRRRRQARSTPPEPS